MSAALIFLYFIIALAVIAVFLSIYTVNQQTVAMIERFGRFHKVSQAGLQFRIPFIDQIRARISLRVMQLNVEVETKTQDNVFVKVTVSVQFCVASGKSYEAYYKLDNPETQITSYVFDVVRARVPNLKLDDVFERKDEIADAVKNELTETMTGFGYDIVKALVTDIDPDAKVKAAMNEINEAQRLRVAANEKGEAEKILKVKQAEAEAQSAALQGEGIANQRRAIIDGLRASVDEFQKSIDGAQAQDVMSLVLMTQYFDTLKSIGADSKNSSVLIPHTPGAIGDFMSQIRNSVISADQIDK